VATTYYLHADRTLSTALLKPAATVIGLAGVSLLCLSLYPFLGVSFFPRTDPGQFVINVKASTGSHVENTDKVSYLMLPPNLRIVRAIG